MKKKICVFCAARDGFDDSYLRATRHFGSELAAANFDLVYGGGNVGLMGALADAVLDGGGEVYGVIPEFLASKEILHDGIQHKIVVTDLFERKDKMIAMADAFAALPGGIGTFDELLEVLTWQQLNQIDKPVGLLNVHNYFEHLVAMLQSAVDNGFYDQFRLDSVISDPDPASLIQQLVTT